MPAAYRYVGSFLLVSLLGLLFLPGLHGPFVFDDITNITSNYYLKLTSLSWATLQQASLSGNAGPLGRPIPMLSFALDHYLAGGFSNTFPFKLHSLLIHLTNGCLVFIFTQLVYSAGIKGQSNDTALDEFTKWGVSLTLCILWVIHPIQTNAVHYVVQRMTSLSALFVLLTVIFYIYGRQLLEKRNNKSFVFLFILAPVSFLAGLFSKENAALAIPFIAVLEYFFFRESFLWHWLRRIDCRIVISITILVIAAGATALTLFSLPGYGGRDFTLTERVLSEARVLAYYLYLIFFPVITNFGLFHDDFQLSTGILDPVSTLLSVAFLVGLIVIAIRYRKDSPYLSLGIAWYLVAHSLESTVLPLELIHEHRNYLALLGPLLTLKPLLEKLYSRKGPLIGSMVAVTIIIAVSFPAYLRSVDWKSHENLIIAESSYHPRSARAQGALGAVLTEKGDIRNGIIAMATAHSLLPKEGGYLINMILMKSMAKEPIPGDWETKIYSIISNERISPLTIVVLNSATTCAITQCAGARLVVENIASLCAARTDISSQHRSQCYYFLGSILGHRDKNREAIRALEDSYRLDPEYLHPLFGSALIYLKTKDYVGARSTIERLIIANRRVTYKRPDELRELIELYNREAEKRSLPGGKIDVSL